MVSAASVIIAVGNTFGQDLRTSHQHFGMRGPDQQKAKGSASAQPSQGLPGSAMASGVCLTSSQH